MTKPRRTPDKYPKPPNFGPPIILQEYQHDYSDPGLGTHSPLRHIRRYLKNIWTRWDHYLTRLLIEDY